MYDFAQFDVSLVIGNRYIRAEDCRMDEERGIPTSQRFWGLVLEPGKPFTLTLSRTDLHLTNASVTAQDGSAVLIASSSLIKDIPLCTLSTKGPRQCLLDVDFFEHDETCTLRVEGTCPINVAGTVALFGPPLPDSDDEETNKPVKKGTASNAGAHSAKTKRPAPREEDDEEEAREDEEDEEDIDEYYKEEVKEGKPAATQPQLSAVEKLKAAKRKREEGEGEGTAAPPAAAKQAKPTPAAESASSSSTDSHGLKSLANGKVKYKDLAVGSGPAPTPGKPVTVLYVGKLANGKVFDTNKHGFKFRIGTGQVIKGWDVGVAGMRVGGKRLLVIHPDMGYGKRGAGGDIPPNATLLFEVELLKASG